MGGQGEGEEMENEDESETERFMGYEIVIKGI